MEQQKTIEQLTSELENTKNLLEKVIRQYGDVLQQLSLKTGLMERVPSQHNIYVHSIYNDD